MVAQAEVVAHLHMLYPQGDKFILPVVLEEQVIPVAVLVLILPVFRNKQVALGVEVGVQAEEVMQAVLEVQQ